MPTGSWIICASVLLLAFSLARGDDEEQNNQGKTNDDKNKDLNTPNNNNNNNNSNNNNNVTTGGSTTVKQPVDTTTAPYSPTCGVPPPDACANIKVGQIDTTGNVASYTCKSPYKLTGQHSLVCSRTGSWDGVDSTKGWPSCKVDCDPAPDEPMAWVSAEGYGNYSAKVPWAIYQCNTSYHSAVSTGNTTRVTCDPYTLEWERPNLHCTAPQHGLTANVALDKNLSFLVDGNHGTCVNFTHDGSAIIHFYTSLEVYNITLRATSSGDISLNMSLMNVDIETTNWQEPRILKTAWTNGKVFPWVDGGTPLVGTSLTITLTVMEHVTWFSFCEVEVTGRPHLADCSKPPHPRYGQQLRSVKSGRCDLVVGPCALGTQVEYECQKGFLQTSGESVITCSDYRNWTELTLQCAYAPLVKVLLNSRDENRCTPVNTSTTTFPMEHLELQSAVVNISIANSTKASNLLAKGNSRIFFEYLLSQEKYVTCEGYNLTKGTSLYAFDCLKRPVAQSVQLRFSFENAVSEISICFIKVIAREYDKALECVQASPVDYKGRLNTAYTGETCDLWSSQFKPNDTLRGESLDSAANFCRNLGNVRLLPWCFVNGTQKNCAVVACDQACVLPWSNDGAEYVGQQDFEMETAMSWKCLGWNETSHTDVCPVVQKSMFVDGNSNTSYCRNPDRRTTGPWCNVRPCLHGGCGATEMNCKIPTCPKTDQIENGTINVQNDTEKARFLTTHMVECWVYNNGSMKRYGMPHVQPVTMDAIDRILQGWCDMSSGRHCLTTCHNTTNWYRLTLLCDMNITNSVEWASSILPTLSTKDVSSTFFIKETASTKDTLMTPSMMPSYSVPSQIPEVSSHNWFSHSTAVTQTATHLGPMTTWQGRYGPSSSSVHEHMTAQTATPVSLSQTIASQHGTNLHTGTDAKSTETVVKVASTTTFQSRITPSSSSTHEHISTQTVSDTRGQTTSQQGISRSYKAETNTTQAVTSAQRGQTTTLQSGSTPPSSPPHENKTSKNHCPCWCTSDKPSDSLQETEARAAKLSQFLQVHKAKLSKTINGKISKYDKRDSASLISWLFSLVIILMLLSLIIVPDLLTVIIYMSHRSPTYDTTTSAPEK